jgi:hypothetical protein
MRHTSAWATLAAMKITSPGQRLTLDAAIDRVPVGELEDGCERRCPLFADQYRTTVVRLG